VLTLRIDISGVITRTCVKLESTRLHAECEHASERVYLAEHACEFTYKPQEERKTVDMGYTEAECSVSMS
jgi:hypothetical protein